MSDILYIPDIAKRLGITEAAVRSALQRRSKSLPPHCKLGGRVAFRTSDYEKWLASLKPRGQH